MPLPTLQELTEALRFYLDAPASEFMATCVKEAVSFIQSKIPTTVTTEVVDGYIVPTVVALIGMSDEIYQREVLELGADLFYRRQAKNGVVTVDSMSGMPMRIANDPWKASEQRLQRFMPLGFA